MCVGRFWHIAALAACRRFGRYWGNSRHQSALVLNGRAAFDPTATSASISCCSSETAFRASSRMPIWAITMPPVEPWEANVRRREFLGTLGGVATWPFAAQAQQQALPVIGFVNTGSPTGSAARAAGFRQGLLEGGAIEGQNAAIEYHWLEGRNERLPGVMADLARRRVAVIATPGSVVASLAAKAATTTIPIVFGVPEDPVHLGLVDNLARPGGNATGVNSFSQEVTGKRLRLLHDLLPKAVRLAVLLNPGNASSAGTTLRVVQEAAPALGLQLQLLNATNSAEIDAAFATLSRQRPEALFVAPDAYFNSRGVQFSTLAARERIPAAYSDREVVAAGGLMSYGADLPDMARQVGVYTGRIIKGAKPGELPVLQSTKFQIAINIQTARALGIEVPSGVISIADEVIE
jgi:putative tryptophan/tyrosine transport system substrate-binding protein